VKEKESISRKDVKNQRKEKKKKKKLNKFAQQDSKYQSINNKTL
jgi:hypothetical protein